jgi:predicted lipoprotein with Yx(FWY)xxD motif
MRKTLVIVVAAIAVLATTTAAGAGKSVTISTRKVAKLGTVLVNAKGMTLYMFVPDRQRRVTCVKSCAVAWPPVKTVKGQKLVALGGAKQSLLSSDVDPAGGRVVTYARWPLYTYVGDTKPGQATGQAIDANGGLWYVLAPSGKVIKTKP